MPVEINRDPLEDVFIPRRGLKGGHMQTLAAYFSRRTDRLPAAEERLFSVEPDVQVLCHCHWQPERKETTTLMIVHGLEGSSTSQYVVGTANKAWAAGMNVVRMNMRNCGGTERLSATLYHSGLSADVGAVARALIEQEQLASIALAGFSMGGNLVLKIAGEWGRDVPRQLCAVCAVSPAVDLSASADALHRWDNRLYEWWFLVGLAGRMQRKAELFPDRFRAYPLVSIRSIREFDDRVTARYFGFAGAEDYYRRASAAQVIEQIAAPTLVIHALDDPFIRMLPETRQKLMQNLNVRLLESNHGGHCAFLANANGYDGRWSERRIIRFIEEQSPGEPGADTSRL
jgi:predicted alpha/beta-fold hydrolase